MFIETQQSNNSKDFLQLIQGHLLTLYTLGLTLPDIELTSNFDLNTDISATEMKTVLLFIGKRVPFSYYCSALNPMKINDTAETGLGDLIDDLGDIYKDVKRALVLFNRKQHAAKENSIWHFKFHYDNHWGEHCIEALQAIHHYLYANR